MLFHPPRRRMSLTESAVVPLERATRISYRRRGGEAESPTGEEVRAAWYAWAAAHVVRRQPSRTGAAAAFGAHRISRWKLKLQRRYERLGCEGVRPRTRISALADFQPACTAVYAAYAFCLVGSPDVFRPSMGGHVNTRTGDASCAVLTYFALRQTPWRFAHKRAWRVFSIGHQAQDSRASGCLPQRDATPSKYSPWRLCANRQRCRSANRY